MRVAFLVLFCVLSVHAGSQDTPDPETQHEHKVADIRKLMTLTGGDKMANQMLDQMAANMRSAGGIDSEKYFQEFRKEFDLNKVFELQVAAYDKYLSAADVRALVQFYESPAGRRMVEAMPQIMGDMMQAAMQMSQEIAQKVAQKMKEQQK